MPNLVVLRDVKQFVRAPYAWPGGYPLFLVTTDSGCICHDCTKRHFRQIIRAEIDSQNDGWRPSAVTVNWEDSDLLCDNCGLSIESAYGNE
jgi:hypothetical protein